MKWKFMRFGPYDLPLIFFFISAALSVWPAHDPQLSVRPLIAYAVFGLLVWALTRAAVKPQSWRAAALALAGLGVLFSGYYITQLGHMGFEVKIGMLSRLAAGIARFTPDVSFFHPLGNTAGTFLEGLIFLQVGLALREPRRAWKTALWGAAALSVFALILSASRGAWLAVGVGGLLWAGLYWKPARYALIAGAAGLAVLALAVALSRDLTLVDRVPVVGDVLGALFIRPDRLNVYYHSLVMISETPFTGIGLGGQFAMAYSRYQLYLHVPYLYYSHNLFLEIWLEQGVLGIFAWLWLVASILRNAWLYRGEAEKRVWFESTWVGLAAVLIHGLSDASQTQHPWCWLGFFGLLGLNSALIRGQHLRIATQEEPTHPAGRRSLTGWLPSRWIPAAHWLPAARWLPAAASAAVVGAVWLAGMPLAGAAALNQGALLQQRAELAPGLTDSQRAALLDQAAAAFEKALRQDPHNFGAHHRLGLMALMDGQVELAIEHLERASQSHPQHLGVRKLLGLAYIYHGDVSQAVVYLRDLLNIKQEMQYYADHYERLGQGELSLYFSEANLLLQPGQPQVEMWMGEEHP